MIFWEELDFIKNGIKILDDIDKLMILEVVSDFLRHL